MTQEEVSRIIGFKDRQTLAAIEGGERRITAEELARAAAAVGVTVDDLTDPYRLFGEGRFSFRAKSVDDSVLDNFQQTAGRWIATYRQLGRARGQEPKRLGQKLELSRTSSFEDAQAAAEELVLAWNLGDQPSARLADAITRSLGALVLFADAPRGISGAASHVPGLPTIIVNRQEAAGRRAFDLVHELFHILTWDAMPPDRVESCDVKRSKGNRVEQLAENFAAALLMPRATVVRLWERRGSGELHDWLNSTATDLGVSAIALKWRLRNLNLLASTTEIDTERLVANGRPESADQRPRLFSKEFVDRVHEGVESGRLSLRRAAGLLDLSVTDLARLFGDYGLTLSYEV